MADLTRSEAWELLKKYNKEPFHLRHALTVEGIMKYFAKELGYADEADFWAQVGLLHDLDFEVYPAEHCLKSQEIMREHGLDERLIRATASHGYGLAQNDIEPQHQMEKVLFAIDELSARDVIEKGAANLGWTVDELIEKTILAMREDEAAINEACASLDA